MMNLKSRPRPWSRLAAAAGISAASFVASAQSVNLVPAGALRVTINAGSVVAPVTTAFAIPLVDVPAATGATAARIGTLTATSLTVPGAGWTAGALASPAFPYAIRISTGVAAGATFPINGNTTDTLTFSSVDLTTQGIVAGNAGDSFRLIPLDTLNSLFGANTFVSGANPTEADVITLSSGGTQLSYYYHATLSRWVRTTGPTTDRGNNPIPPDGMIGVTRKSSAITLTFIGRVPDVRFSVAVANSGPTYTHAGFPTDVSLAALGMPAALTGWVSGSSASTADTVSVSSGATWLSYFYNGTYWQRTTGPATNRDAIVIVAGTPILVFRPGTAGGTTTFNRALPYSF